MSVCLGVIKGFAISSLGIYTGILSTSTIIAFTKPTSTILASLDIISKAQLTTLINEVFKVGNVIGAISTTLFGLSYWGAPKRWRHPYLLYAMLTTPLSTLYLYYVKKSIENRLRLQQAKTDSKPIDIADENNTVDESIDGSVVDLGQKSTPPSSPAPSSRSITVNDATVQNNALFCNSIGRKLLVTTVVSIAGLTQSIIGVYGEGYFT
ncbi:autophagy-related protein 33 [Monosporozyma servazzii]